LDTFSKLGPNKNTRGVVDFVRDYIQTGKAPRASEYAYECPAFAEKGGSLLVMPAGTKHQPSYESRLCSIDWQKLYSEQHGYLLFEDLKFQWARDIKPDYVLVDSRTGYTDVAGICTRQLPDAVVILFFPTEQNLSGLADIVSGIRDEAAGARKKAIQLHFVTSNVPDLDDEDQILEKRIARFKRGLGYEQLAVIHHYPSLALLNQVIFTKERPRSRLAKEYRAICWQILRYNLKDREGALSFLRTPGEPGSPDRPKDLDKALDEIAKYHSTDGEVLAHLGKVHSQLGRLDSALSFYDDAIARGFESCPALLDRARIQLESGLNDSAAASAERALALPSAQIFDVNFAVRLLLRLEPSRLQELPSSPALKALSPPERLTIAQELQTRRDVLPIEEAILRQSFPEIFNNTSLGPNPPFNLEKTQLTLCLIGQRRFVEAMNLISSALPVPADLNVVDAFNYGMALWGNSGRKPMDYFSRVVACDADSRLDGGLNPLQCASLAYWVVGNAEEARARLKEARDMLESRPQSDFSAWRYLQMPSREFRKDLDAMESMFDGAPVLPEVLAFSSDGTPHS